MPLLLKSPLAADPVVVLYPVYRKELVQVKLALSLRWRGRATLLREIRFYCQYAEIFCQISSEGGFFQSRHVLTAQGEAAQMEALVGFLETVLRKPGVVAQGALAGL